MEEARILKLFFLDLDGKPIVSVTCVLIITRPCIFTITVMIERFGSLSVGLLGKVLSIKESIQSGKKTYDFLKGAEVYKKRLGGQPIQLYRCLIELS